MTTDDCEAFLEDKYGDSYMNDYYNESFMQIIFFINKNKLDSDRDIEVLFMNGDKEKYNDIDSIFKKYLNNRYIWIQRRGYFRILYNELTQDEIDSLNKASEKYPMLNITINFDNYNNIDTGIKDSLDNILELAQNIEHKELNKKYGKKTEIQLFGCIKMDKLKDNQILNNIYDYLFDKYSKKELIKSFKIAYSLDEYGKTKIFMK
jgi:hypothetical protein